MAQNKNTKHGMQRRNAANIRVLASVWRSKTAHMVRWRPARPFQMVPIRADQDAPNPRRIRFAPAISRINSAARRNTR